MGQLEAPATVVLVEDDAALLAALAFMFEIDGFEVRGYASAETALADDGFPERGCLVVDYLLPQMNGLALLERLREKQIFMPAILITSHPAPALRVQAARQGVPIVEKPLLQDELVENVRWLMQPRADA